MNDKTQRHDAGDRAKVERARLEKENADRQYRADLRWLLADPRGRRLMANFLKENGVDPSRPETSFTGNSKTFELEGMRRAAKVQEARFVKFEPELYITMLREHFIPQESNNDDRHAADHRAD